MRRYGRKNTKINTDSFSKKTRDRKDGKGRKVNVKTDRRQSSTAYDYYRDDRAP